ncbi:hypothetical protein HYU23_01970 [Candidatus Woesearchaeota archaeon]|nr:hypothetical protein [Candidatus Woesearchaeota archaeon]
MNAEQILKKLCNDLRYDLSVMRNAAKIHEMAVRKGYDRKYKPIALVAGSLYFYCKSSGKPIVMNMILERLPVESDELNAIYNELKKETLF